MGSSPSMSLRCPICGMDTSDPEHRGWACEQMAQTVSQKHPLPSLICAYCGRTMVSWSERCGGSFLDTDHPPNVEPIIGSPPNREQA